MKPIYRFGLNTEDGSIEVREITEYEYKLGPSTKSYYKYRGKSQWNYAKEKNFDKMVNNAVYTFNSSEEYARQIIRGVLFDKRSELIDKLEKVDDLLSKIDNA